jgi:hypothetical protein
MPPGWRPRPPPSSRPRRRRTRPPGGTRARRTPRTARVGGPQPLPRDLPSHRSPITAVDDNTREPPATLVNVGDRLFAVQSKEIYGGNGMDNTSATWVANRLRAARRQKRAKRALGSSWSIFSVQASEQSVSAELPLRCVSADPRSVCSIAWEEPMALLCGGVGHGGSWRRRSSWSSRCSGWMCDWAFGDGRGSRLAAGRMPRAGAGVPAASGSRSWCRRRTYGSTLAAARRWWPGRRRAAPRTAPAALRWAGPAPGRAKSPPKESIEHLFATGSAFLLTAGQWTLGHLEAYIATVSSGPSRSLAVCHFGW